MRLSLLVVLLLAVPAMAQPVDGARQTIKRVYALATPSDSNDRAVGELSRTEIETYGTDGRRLRVEWRDASGAVLLSFMELYDADDQPFGAVYFEGADLDPTLEQFDYRSEGDRTVKRVSYSGGDGEVTSVNEFVTDAEGREVERRYGVADGPPSGTDTVTYDGANATGYVYASTDGSRRVEYTFRTETTDALGNWTSRVVLREGMPSVFETREIEYLGSQ
ncbi:MAG: hypothetical protein AAGK21_15120 [Bacteroidota bacterium]